MAVNTSNTAGFSALNLYKMSLEANKDMAREAEASLNTTGNEDYRVYISEEAQQLAQAARNESFQDTALQTKNQSVIGGSAEAVLQNMVEIPDKTEQNRSVMSYAVELFA